jgi:hypothetical protein
VASFSRLVQKEIRPVNPARIFNLAWSRAWTNPTNGDHHGLLDTNVRSSGPVLKEELIVDNLEKEATAPLSVKS